METNVNFLLDLSKHPEFVAANVHTNFIRDHNDSLFRKDALTDQQLVQGAMALVLTDELGKIEEAIDFGDHFNPFVVESGFRINYQHCRDVKLKRKDVEFSVKVKAEDGNKHLVSLDNGASWCAVDGQLLKEDGKFVLKCNVDGEISKVNVFRNDANIVIFDKVYNELLRIYRIFCAMICHFKLQNGKFELELEKNDFEEDEAESGTGADKAVAPMPGVLDKVLVKMGDCVKLGDPLFVIIAMKMEYVVKASRDAIITEILNKVGDNVQKDAVIVKFQEAAEQK